MHYRCALIPVAVFLENSDMVASNPVVLMWRRITDDLSIEQARFVRTETGPEISGLVMIAEEGSPLRVDYRVVCDATWRTREVEVEQTWHGSRQTLRLDHDGAGRWRRDGRDASTLDGCTDVDLSVSPSTTASPINRLRLPVGGTSEIRAAWVRFPDLGSDRPAG